MQGAPIGNRNAAGHHPGHGRSFNDSFVHGQKVGAIVGGGTMLGAFGRMAFGGIKQDGLKPTIKMVFGSTPGAAVRKGAIESLKHPFTSVNSTTYKHAGAAVAGAALTGAVVGGAIAAGAHLYNKNKRK